MSQTPDLIPKKIYSLYISFTRVAMLLEESLAIPALRSQKHSTDGEKQY